jgi:DNA-directed RNA polymerase subunit RPC12/RpoP
MILLLVLHPLIITYFCVSKPFVHSRVVKVVALAVCFCTLRGTKFPLQCIECSSRIFLKSLRNKPVNSLKLRLTSLVRKYSVTENLFN